MYALMLVAVLAFGDNTETVRVDEVQYGHAQCLEVEQAFKDELYANTTMAGGKIVAWTSSCKPL